MKAIHMIFTSAIALGACQDEHSPEAFPDLAEGTYRLEIFNEMGKKVLERNGTAIGLGSYSQLLMEDPEFATPDNDPATCEFAYLLVFTDPDHEQRWDEQSHWTVRAENAGAVLNQQYYNVQGDWRYESTSGYVNVVESTETRLKGTFRIDMKTPATTDDFPIAWTYNKAWGDRITIKGYFLSKGW